MKKLLCKSLAALSALSAPSLWATIPLDYYAAMQGLSGEELKNAVHDIIGNEDVLSPLNYGSGNGATWWGFYVTDRNEDNTVVDRYSLEVRSFGSRGSSISGMNIEHSFPKSWWGGTTNYAYRDLFNLMPCEQKINSTKSNYPMGVVKRPTANGDNGCTKVGDGADGQRYWEPADMWKGDFARGYMYMATAYQQLDFSNNQAQVILKTGNYPTLLPAASKLFMEWARRDDVQEIEVVRNDNVQSIQRNRNPFVDFPNLMEYIWGDSIGTPLNLMTTRKSAPVTGSVGGGDNPDTPVDTEIFSNSLIGDEAGFTEVVIENPSNLPAVWTNSPQYGWVGTAFKGGNYAAVADLVSPEIDLANCTEATLAFDHALNYCKAAAPENTHKVMVRFTDGSRADLPITLSRWPSGSSWGFVKVNDLLPTDVNGKKIQIVFHYTSTASEASTWEVKNLTIRARKSSSGIRPVTVDPALSDLNAPVTYYSLDGRQVDPATHHGLAIRRQGTTATKVLLP